MKQALDTEYNINHIFCYRQIERIFEIRQLSEFVPNDKQAKIIVLKKFLEDRIVESTTSLTFYRSKTGITRGELVQRNSDQHIFMVKFALKFHTYQNEHRNKNFHSMSFINEFVTAPFYKRTLYERVPIIEGVVGASEGWGKLRSKYLNNFQTISTLTNGSEQNEIGPYTYKLRGIVGAEKLFAAMLFAAEYDWNPGNLGVMTTKDEGGNDIRVFAKVDHGWAATQFFSSSHKMFLNFSTAFITVYHYKTAFELDLSKFKLALEEIIQISDEEISTMVKSRTHKLKRMGFDINGLEFSYFQNDTTHYFDSAKIFTFLPSTFEQYEEFFIKKFQVQKDTIYRFHSLLGVIDKINHPNKDWKKGRWLIEINGESPAQWAGLNKCNIEGIDPIVWGIQNQWLDNKEAFMWAHKKKIKIEGLPSLEWQQKNMHRISRDTTVTNGL